MQNILNFILILNIPKNPNFFYNFYKFSKIISYLIEHPEFILRCEISNLVGKLLMKFGFSLLLLILLILGVDFINIVKSPVEISLTCLFSNQVILFLFAEVKKCILQKMQFGIFHHTLRICIGTS